MFLEKTGPFVLFKQNCIICIYLSGHGKMHVLQVACEKIISYDDGGHNARSLVLYDDGGYNERSLVSFDDGG